MAKVYIELTHEEAQGNLPYSLICMVRYGARWDTMHRKLRWMQEFTEEERAAASDIFRRAHDWTVGRGVPANVKMTTKTYALWQKLGCFCGSI